MAGKNNLHVEARKKFGAYLAEHRHKRGLSQGAVAQSLGYSSPQFISNFERGLCTPPNKKLQKLIKLYGVPKTEVVDMRLAVEAAKLREAFAS